MKSSKYNFFIDHPSNEDMVLAYNPISNGLAVVSNKVMFSIENGETSDDLEGLDEVVFNNLKKGGFIIEDDYDEFQLVRFRQQRNQYMIPSLCLTIAPTINCNLACHYCFEEHIKGKMSEKVMDGIVAFVERELSKGLENLSVTWYGGEPLLYPEQVEKLSQRLINIADERKVKYFSNIITNGTTMTPEVADMLVRCRISDVQVTVDGPKAIHDTRRVYKGGQGSYDKIVENIGRTLDKVHYSIRINVDKSNVEEADGVFAYFKSQEWYDPKRIAFYYGWVRAYTDQVANGNSNDLSPENFHDESERFASVLRNKGARKGSYPTASMGCVATTVNGYVIGPDGDMWKCWSNIGDKSKVIGNVWDGIEHANKHYLAYMQDTWEFDEECKNCKVLPICMGGCTDIRHRVKESKLEHRDCDIWRYKMKDKILAYYAHMQRQNTASAV